MTFRFRLNLRNKRIAEAYVRGSKDRTAKATRQIDRWVKGESNFDRDRYIELWEIYRKQYGDNILELALKTMAVGNSVVDVNHILRYNMGMPQAQINDTFIKAALRKTFNVNMADLLLKDSKLDQKTQQLILERIVAREFPQRHERTTMPVQTGLPDPATTARQIGEQMMREIRRGEK